MAALLLTLTGGAFANAATPLAAFGSTWYVSTLPRSIDYRVSRPAIALTVVVPPGPTPAIGGTVTVGTQSLPVTLLRSQPVPGAIALTLGEDSLTLPPSGRASIHLVGPGSLSLATQSFTFTVAAGAPATAPPPTPAESAFIAELNAYRAQVGAPPVAVSAALTAAAAAHAAFVSGQPARYGTGVSVHDEPVAWRTLPGWTGLYARNRDLAFGSATGGGVEVMSSGNSDPVAFLVAETVFHRDLLLDPAALVAGAADVGGQFVLDLSDWGGATGVQPTLWPPDAAKGVPLAFGGEWPSPLQPFAGLRFPAGTPVTWDDYAAPPGTQIINASFTLMSEPGGQPVAGAVLTPQLWQPYTETGVFMGVSVAFIPDRPLAADTTYLASVRAVEAPPTGGQRQMATTWTFTTGDGSVLPPGGVAEAASPTVTTQTNPAVTTVTSQAAATSTTSTGIAGGGQNTTPSTSQPATTGSDPTVSPGGSRPAATNGSQVATTATSQAAATVTVPQDPWTVVPANVTERLAALAAAGKARTAANPTYTDLYLAPWAAPAVDALSAAGVVHGIGSDMFGPNDPLTTGQLAAALVSFVPPPSTVTPTSLANAAALPAWAVRPLQEAVGAGWIDAPGGLVAVNAWATRATAVEALTRLLGWSQAAAAYAASGGGWPAGIKGDAGMSGEPENDLLWAAHLGLVDGVDGQVAGAQALTRAQLAVLLWRIVQKAGT